MCNGSSSTTTLLLMVSLIAITAIGCGTMSKEDCTHADWNHVGFIDGRMGKDSNYIDDHRKACGQTVPRADVYEKGRLRGVKEYCTPRSAYNEGSHGRPLADLCPNELTAELSKQHDEGRKTYELQAERHKMQEELNKKRERIDNDNSVVGDITKTVSLLTGISQTASEESRINDLTEKIHARDSLAPAGRPPVPSLHERINANPIPAVQNILAITAGSIFGFGTGHWIQGTYLKDGWKWTAIDAMNVVGLSVVSANCTTAPDPITGTRGSKTTGACVGSTIALVSGIIVSRVWQGIEIANTSSILYSPYQISVVPSTDGGTLLAVWNW